MKNYKDIIVVKKEREKFFQNLFKNKEQWQRILQAYRDMEAKNPIAAGENVGEYNARILNLLQQQDRDE